MQTLGLINILQSCGHAVFLVCYFEHENNMLEKFSKPGVIVRLLDMNRKSGIHVFIWRLFKEIHSIRPDVVHVQYMAPGTLPIIAARLAGVKMVFATVHQPYSRSHSRLAKLMLRIGSLLTTRFIAVSENAEKSWFGTSNLFDDCKPFKLQPHHFTIHNSIDVGLITNIVEIPDNKNLKNTLNLPSGMLVIGSVSRLRFEKGIDLLIEAYRLMIPEYGNVHLLIIGSGPDEGKLKDQAASFGISDKITFYSAVDWECAIRFISIMDIVVVPSRFEGFGLTAAEAMAAGKPVIVSDNFGLKEVVTDQETGLTFKTEDITDLKNKLKILLNNPALCKQYGKAGIRRAKDLFDISVFNKKITTLYNKKIQSIN
jgi:L-malate glycosyltransferase